MSTNPNIVKSQSDLNPCNDGKRSSDVLIEAISKAELLQKQLDIAVAGLQYYANEDIYIETHKIVNGKNEWASEVMLDNGVKDWYEPLDGINCDNILAEDWEIVEDEQKS